MPAPSPSSRPGGMSQAPGSDYFPESDFLESGSMANRVSQIADGQVAELEVLHSLDPDQVSDVVAKKRLGLGFWIASGWVGLIALLALLAPVLPLTDPNFQNYNAVKVAPNSQFWLGTDDLGRDQL